MLTIKPKTAVSTGLFPCRWVLWAVILFLAACALDPSVKQEDAPGKVVCDSYLILDMCVQDLVGDGVVDMIYFTDTIEIFMYRDGMKDTVGQVMPFHQCAVPLSVGMQEITNRILGRENLSFSEELAILRDLFANYMVAKPEIDACNARFAGENPDFRGPREEFFIEEWAD